MSNLKNLHLKPLVIIADLIAVVILVLLFVFKTQKTAILDVLVTPLDATISINGQKYENGTYAVVPGEYTAVISHDNLETKTITVTAEANKTSKIYVYLTGENDDFSYYEAHDWDLETLDSISAKTSDAAAEAFTQKMDIREILPYEYVDLENYVYFKIEQGSEECESDFCLCITDHFGGSEALAYAKIAEQGYDLNDYEVHYYDEMLEKTQIYDDFVNSDDYNDYLNAVQAEGESL